MTRYLFPKAALPMFREYVGTSEIPILFKNEVLRWRVPCENVAIMYDAGFKSRYAVNKAAEQYIRRWKEKVEQGKLS